MRKKAEEPGMNMTPMIDVVFQLIIFFVTTVDLEKKAIDENLKMAMAPHGVAVEKKDPRTVFVDVDQNGRISIARTYMSPAMLRVILRKAVSQHGQTIPVVIQGDGRAKHEAVKQVMDSCAAVGLWKVKFAATKEIAGKPKS
ncbi:MAG: biopolymer transporter ExbD [Verrucomicrobia bacterium]|nr:biopolymer transporter ExbD [Verrucomicrobiota bacterium]